MQHDLFKVLQKDHQEVKDILEQLKETSKGAQKTREKLFGKLKEEITPHMKAEEKAFYPALKENKETREDTLESIEEHHVTELILNELDKMPKNQEEWAAKLSVFKELVEHHLEEEESNLFEKANEVLDEKQIGDILKRFQAHKQEVKKSLS